jgi:primosomal protein N' (replication factor Y)
VLIGTQMIAKGHDFRRVSLVAAVQPDAALFASDFRAAERLFALLMQAAGRAGRDAGFGSQAEMWVQTHQPAHPLYAALKRLDYAAFAEGQLREREQAGLPPFAHQALLRADARTQEDAQAFLQAAAEALRDVAARDARLAPLLDAVTLYPAVPLTVQRVARVERAQMLLESPSRAALQRLMHAWQPLLHAQRPAHRGLIRWLFDVDPMGI